MAYIKNIVLLLAAAMLASCGDGKPVSAPTQRIINGTSVASDDAPQFVQVRLMQGGAEMGRCSGTVIAPDRVLTAGHCVNAGEDEAWVMTSSRLVRVVESRRHPEYREEPALRAIFNDVAVLTTDPLETPALGITASRTVEADGVIATYGFGLNEDNEYGALQAAQITIAFVTNDHLFSAPFESGGSNPCLGDSGAPAVLAHTDESGVMHTGVIGVVSTGTAEGCAEGDITLFANLQNPSVLGFIAEAAPGAVIQ